MKELFGIPVGGMLEVLAVALALALGAVAALATRNRVLLRLGLRNVARRRARTALIVVGLMLATTIIAAALATGDTMSTAIRNSAIESLGQTDELVSPSAAKDDVRSELGAATGTAYFDERAAARVETALAGSDLVDGVTAAIIEPVAVQNPARRSNEPNVMLFAADPARMTGFGTISGSHGRAVRLSDLRPGELYLNADAADELNAQRGDRVLVFTGSRPAALRVRDIVRYDGGGTQTSGALVGLDAAQSLLGRPGKVEHVLVSNAGGTTSGAKHTDAVIERLRPLLAPLRLDAEPAKRDAIQDADEFGSAFMAFFTTFGSFSIAAGILLIFLIFVMLAAERRGELGIARAIGTRRSQLVQMFLFEGVAYDVLAAAVGTALGAGIAYGMVSALAQAFGEEGFDLAFSVTGRSLLIAYAIGVLLTLVVVALSASRVSRMTIATAIRNLPEPSAQPRRRRRVLALATIVLGLLMAVSGAGAGQATPLMLGVSIVLVGLVPFLRLVGLPERIAYTGCGVTLVVIWMLPWSVWEAVFGNLSMDFSVWIVSGLMVVTGAVWTIMYNAAALMAATSRAVSRIRGLAPVLRMSMAYPLAARFRTGMTLAMFTLIVFTLVTGTASSGSFVHAFDNEAVFGGGFDVRASTSATAPLSDVSASLERAGGADRLGVRTVASQSLLPVQAGQRGTTRGLEPYSLRGLDDAFLRNTTFALGARARGYGSTRAVWRALGRERGLAVVDATIAPRRDNFAFQAAPPDFKLTGFFYDDGVFDPIPLTVRDAQTGRSRRLEVIGILSDTAPFEMLGISTSQRTVATGFPGRATPTIHYFQTTAGAEPEQVAKRLESTFLANGMEAESIHDVLDDAMGEQLMFNRLILGFMGLGLIVGVAALGVISARSVVERRQQIGVLRSIGFRRGMVQGALLLESTFVALTAIVVGTTLGLLLAANIIRDQRKQPSWEDVGLVVPWGHLAIIFAAVFAVALLATLAPAIRASRVRPAEALRYQ